MSPHMRFVPDPALDVTAAARRLAATGRTRLHGVFGDGSAAIHAAMTDPAMVWNRAIRTIGANKAGPFVHLMPVFSTILAVLFLDESLAWHHAQGIALIFGGILMTTFRTGTTEQIRTP